MSDKGIFLDILPRFDMAAAAAIITKVQGLFKKAGVESSMAFGKGASEGLRVLQAEMIRTENAASNMYIKMRKAAGDFQVAEARVNELRAKNVEQTSARFIAALNKEDIARQRSIQLAKEQAAAQSAALDAQAAVAAKQASIAEASVAASATKMGTLGMVATGTLALIGAKSVDAAGKYEASLTKIQSTTGESADAIKKLGDGLLKLGPQVGYSAQELQQAAFLLAKSRVGFNDATAQLGVLKAAAQLAKVEGADLTDVMNGLTTTMVDFGVPAGKAADVASQLRVTVGAAKAPLDQFMGALHNFEPIMKVITQSGGDASSSIGQVGAMLAQMTQNGMSADQASQNLRNTLLHLIDPSGPQRDIMGQLGFKPDDLSKALSDPTKGPIGVMKMVADRIAEMSGDTGHVVLDAMFKSPQATANLETAYSKLVGKSKELADQLNNGVVPSMKELHKQKELDPMLAQWDTMRKKVEGFSGTLKKNQDLVRTIPQIFKNVTGTDQGMMVFSQLFGDEESAQKTIELWHEAAKAKAEANGDVEGTSLVKDTYKFKVDEAKAAWHSLTIQMGEAFLPTAKVVMDMLAKVAEVLTNHPAIMQNVIRVLELLAGRWIFLKAQLVIGPLLTTVATGFTKLWTSISSTFDKTIFGAKKTYAAVTDAAIKSSTDSMIAAEKGAAAQIQSQEKIAAAAQTSSEKQIVSAEATAEKTAAAATISAEKQVVAEETIAVAGEKTNTVVGAGRAEAATIGAAGVGRAAEAEVLAEGRVTTAAERANATISRGGGLLSGGAFLGSMMLPGGDQGRDAVNMGAMGAAIFAPPIIGIPAVGAAAAYDAAVEHGQAITRGDKNVPYMEGDMLGDAELDTTGHAGGGAIRGSGPKGKDSILSYLAPGEHVLTADEVDKLGGHNAVYAMRAAIRGYDTGGAAGSPGYGNFSTLTQWLSQFQGGKYNNATGDDCSGIASQIINVAMGRPALESKMTTRDAAQWLSARGFRRGFKGVGAINIGWYNHGPNTQDGHMAVTLPDGVHAEMGGGHGFLLGPGAAGAESSEFDQHMYLPIAGFAGAPGMPGGSGTAGSPYANAVGGVGGAGGYGFGGGSGGGDKGPGEDYNPFNQLSGGFTLQNLAKFATMFLANLALGNPIGRMEAAKRTAGVLNVNGGGLSSAESNLPTTAAGIADDKAAMRIQNARINAEKMVAKYGEDSPQGIKALNAYRSALETADNRQIKATENAAKYGTKLEELNARLDQLNTKLGEQQANSETKPSTLKATENAIARVNNQIAATTGKLSQLPAAAKSAADSAFTDSMINGEIPRWEDWGYTGGGGQGPVFKRGGGGGAVPDIAPPDHPEKDKVLPMGHTKSGPLGIAPETSFSTDTLSKLHEAVGAATVSRDTFDKAKGEWHDVGKLPSAGPGQSYMSGASQREHRGLPPLAGPVLGDAAYWGQGLTGEHLPAVPKGMKTNAGLPPNAPKSMQDAYKQSQMNALRGAFASPTGASAYGAGKTPAPATLPPSPGPAPVGGGIGMGPGLPAPPPASMSRPASGGTGGGFGVSGGVLGTVEQAATTAAAVGASMAAPGAGAAAGMGMDILTQEANRAIGFMGQVGGILAGGLLETFGLNDSPLSDPSKSLIGKIVGGLAGAHPTGSNSAGMTAPPLQKKDDATAVTNQQGSFGDMNITNNFHGTNDNADQVNREQNRAMLMYGGGSAGQ